jgi:tetratricopeptide (TPR) repeat protein
MSQSDYRQRVIRVFISSTFRDMRAERDHLVKFIFPQLRKLCESRGVIWGEVDLRWGVTDEQAAEGKVLPICLEEIKSCRPYFIGLLGERYGWIPDEIPDDVIEREPWLEEHVKGKKSVTELEILHGVLNNPEMADLAFFYLRDPDYLNHLPEDEDPADFVSESPQHKEKLEVLKQGIRETNFKCHENYPDPEALGELVLKDMTAVIDMLFPEGAEPDPLEREMLDHEAFAESRCGAYIGREEYFKQLDEHADGAGPPLVVLGESGSGKSALLANWVVQYEEKHDEVVVLQHYIGATPDSADWAAMVRRLMGEFKRKFDIQQDIPDKPEELRSAFPNWLYMAAAKGRVVLVLDALNQLEDREGAPDLVWLPPEMPENVRLIVSTLPGRPLDEVKKREWPTMQVELLTPDERKNLTVEFLKQYAKSLNDAQLELVSAANQAANPLYLRVLLDELRQFGEHEKLEERIGYYLQAESVSDLYRRVIGRWDEDYSAGIDLVHRGLTMLRAARRGLSESELLDMLGIDAEPLPRATWSPLYLAMSDSLVSRGGLLTFAHDFLRIATQEECLQDEDDQRQAHLGLADYFEIQPSTPRRTDELPWQLSEGAAWQRLYDVLADATFIKDVWMHNEYDTRRYWVSIEKLADLRMVEAYQQQIDHPEQVEDKVLLWTIGILLADTGHPDESLCIRSALSHYYKSTGDQDNYQASLGNQAVLLQSRGQLDEALALFQEEEGICRRLGNLNGLQASLGNRSVILKSQGEYDEAMALLKEQERLCQQLENSDGLQANLGNQAVILKSQGKYDEAMELLTGKERICRQLGNLNGILDSLGNQANVLFSRGALDEAMTLFKELEHICRQLGSFDTLQRCLGSQAVILNFRGKIDEALTLVEEQKRICRQQGNLDGLQAGLDTHGYILQSQGEYDRAMELHKEAEKICRQLGNLEGLQASLGNQAAICKSRGKLDEALALHQEEEDICRQLGNPELLQASIGNQAVTLELRGEADKAMILLKEKEQICRQLGHMDGLQACLGSQGLILQIRGEFDKAMSLLKEQERICRQLEKLDGLQSSLGNQAVILQSLGKFDEAMRLHKDTERICRQLGYLDGLHASLSNQGLILQSRREYEKALELHNESEQICLKVGNMEGLATTMVNKAAILVHTGRIHEGLPKAEEAYRLASSHGYGALAQRIEVILNKIRGMKR